MNLLNALTAYKNTTLSLLLTLGLVNSPLTLAVETQNANTLNSAKVTGAIANPLSQTGDWNFLVIIVDDLGFMDIAPNNPDTFYQTPNLSKLAKQSVNFSNSYAANPVCSPSRLALMTGVNPARANATDWFHHKNSKRRAGSFKAADSFDFMPDSSLTMAEALPAKYQTTFIGKWHLGESEEYWPEKQGFDTNIAGWSSGSPAGGYFAPYKNPRLAQGENGEYLTKRLTDEAINKLKNAGDDPFLMVLSYYSVHVPLQAPKETIEKYEKLAKPLTAEQEFGQDQQIWPYAKNPRKVRIAQNHPTYAAMVEQMDTNIGRVIEQLESSGLDKNTIVFFTSDNGGLSTSEGMPTSNLPLRGGKGWVYEGGIKVPLMVKIPGVSQGNIVNNTPVIGMDIPATIYDLTQTEVEVLDGQSLMPLLANPAVEQASHQQRPLFWHYPHYSNQGGIPAAAVRLGKYKLIQNLEDGSVSLFNLDDDIGEQNDLANEKPELTKALTVKLANWYKDVDAQFLRKRNKIQPWTAGD